MGVLCGDDNGLLIGISYRPHRTVGTVFEDHEIRYNMITFTILIPIQINARVTLCCNLFLLPSSYSIIMIIQVRRGSYWGTSDLLDP